MRIVYLANSRIPSLAANSVHVMRMCNAFAELGHEVHLVVPDQDVETHQITDIFQFYGTGRDFNVHKIPLPNNGRGKKRVVAAAMADLAQELDPDLLYARNLRAALVTASRGLPTHYEIHQLPERHGHLAAALGYIRRKAEGLRSSRLHQVSQLQMLYRIGAMGDPASVFARLVDNPKLMQVVTISLALKRALLLAYPQLHGRIAVAPDGADPPPPQTSPASLLEPRGTLAVGYIGQLYPGKGMEVIPELARQCPWASFHIVGGQGQLLQEWRERLRSHKNVHLYGAVSPGEVSSYIATMDICLLPNQRQLRAYSQRGRRGPSIAEFTSPLKMFEYMAAGKAIIASNLDVLREILVHQKNALLCPPDDPAAWAHSLNKLNEDRRLLSALGQQAKQDFQQNYTWSIRAQYILDILNICEKGYNYGEQAPFT